jgi:hypothetical protein
VFAVFLERAGEEVGRENVCIEGLFCRNAGDGDSQH